MGIAKEDIISHARMMFYCVHTNRWRTQSIEQATRSNLDAMFRIFNGRGNKTNTTSLSIVRNILNFVIEYLMFKINLSFYLRTNKTVGSHADMFKTANYCRQSNLPTTKRQRC